MTVRGYCRKCKAVRELEKKPNFNTYRYGESRYICLFCLREEVNKKRKNFLESGIL